MNTITKTLLALMILGGFAYAQQVTLTQTTLSSAATASDAVVYVASATGINAPSTTQTRSMLYVIDPGSEKGEAMLVTSISGTAITVQRGAAGTKAMAHVTASLAMIGKPSDFRASTPQGSCTLAKTAVSPWVNILTGEQWLCSTVTLTWVPGFNNMSAPAAPTVVVASAAGKITPSGPLFHVTGTAAVTGFSIPIGFSGGTICAVPDAIFTTTTANNIALASTAVVSKPLCWAYDASAAKFYPNY